MITINLSKPESSDRFIHPHKKEVDGNPIQMNFILLGDEEKLRNNSRKVAEKISRISTKHLKYFWGTLGNASDTPIDWDGLLEFSIDDNEELSQISREEIELIRERHRGTFFRPQRVRRREISFEGVNFDSYFKKEGSNEWKDEWKEFTLDQLPKIRLTLFLRPAKEGALVYYEYEDDKTIEDQHGNPQNDPGDIEYIHPLPTENHSTTERDRLTYIFPIVPKAILEPIQEEGKWGLYRFSEEALEDFPEDKFVVRVLVFRRNGTDSKEIISQMENGLMKKNGKKNPHELLLFNPDQNQFFPSTPEQIKDDQKTILLIHGTFSTTEKSFKHWLDDEEGTQRSFLQKLMDRGYEQILAFDHPTVLEDARANVLGLMHQLPEGFHFKSPIDVVTTSRGGLVGKYLAVFYNPGGNIENGENTKIPIGKAILVSCPNGNGFLDTINNVGKFLRIIKIITRPIDPVAITMIAALGEHSAGLVQRLPGLDVQRTNSQRLKDILDKSLPKELDTMFFNPIIGLYDKEAREEEKASGKIGWGKRVFGGILYNFLKGILGREHDMVNTTSKQYIIHDGSRPEGLPDNYKDYMVGSSHNQYLYKPKVQEEMLKFLTGKGLEEEVQPVS